MGGTRDGTERLRREAEGAVARWPSVFCVCMLGTVLQALKKVQRVHSPGSVGRTEVGRK